jgi:release factor glutamine methyltransferase
VQGVDDVAATLRAAGCVFADEEAALLVEAATGSAQLGAMVRHRATGRPLEQVLGWAEFCGQRLAVEPGVFVPRRRTEALAGEAVRLAGRVARHRTAVVLDLCCGVGPIAAAVAAAVADLELYATDLDPVAVRCARRNLSARARVFEGDLDEPLPDALYGRVDVLTANVPYVPSDEIALLPAEARDHEPRASLDGGVDGLRLLARVASLAPRWLAPGGSMLCETSERQAEQAVGEIARHGLSPRVHNDEDLGATVVVGTRLR